MELNTPTRQPIESYYALLLRLFSVLFGFSFLIGVASQNFYVFTSFIVSLSFFIGLPYAIYQKLYYNNYRYSISQEKVTLEMGILSRNTVAVLFNLVENVNVSESLFLRFFDLATIQFSTSSDNIEIVFSKEDAISLQNLMTSKMAVHRLGIVNQKAD